MKQENKTLSEKIDNLNAKVEDLEEQIKKLCELMHTIARKQRMESFAKKK